MNYVWFNKADDERPWLVRDLETGEVWSAARVMMYGAAGTLFRPEGFPPSELPGGPRGIIVCDRLDMENRAPWTGGN